MFAASIVPCPHTGPNYPEIYLAYLREDASLHTAVRMRDRYIFGRSRLAGVFATEVIAKGAIADELAPHSWAVNGRVGCIAFSIVYVPDYWRVIRTRLDLWQPMLAGPGER